MGFSREQVEKTLLKHGYDEEKALEELLTSVWKSWLTSIPFIKDIFMNDWYGEIYDVIG